MVVRLLGVIRYDAAFLLCEPVSRSIGYPVRYIDYDANGPRQRKIKGMVNHTVTKSEPSIIIVFIKLLARTVLRVGRGEAYGRNIRGR